MNDNNPDPKKNHRGGKALPKSSRRSSESSTEEEERVQREMNEAISMRSTQNQAPPTQVNIITPTQIHANDEEAKRD
jgi:hypothetical protein